MVQDQSNDTAKEAAVEAVHARVVAKPNFIRGSVELLVLYLLSQKDYYGYELSQLMDSLSDGVIKIPIGSLYPALYKLIEYGFISDHICEIVNAIKLFCCLIQTLRNCIL